MGLMPTLHVIAIGGAHQLPHFIPAALELARNGKISVRVFTLDDATARSVAKLADQLGYEVPPITVMALPGPIERLLAGNPRGKRLKVLRLLLWANRLREADALLSAERTSTILKRLPGRCPKFLHIPHGAGDRAVGFEKRIALFDEVLTLGCKDRERMIASGLVTADHCHVVGPMKLASIAQLGRPPRLFDNDRPIILYNPHFDAKLGSFAIFADRMIEWAAGQERYNLVVAPHVRLAEGWPSDRIAHWEDRSVPDKIIVDMGSGKSIDMTYTLSAELYCGDVSSQVYEFLAQPRPCLFVNAHGIGWRDDPDYAMWRFGPVIGPDADIDAAIDLAFATHNEFVGVQREAVRAALDGIKLDDPLSFDGRSVIAAAAALIERLIAAPTDR